MIYVLEDNSGRIAEMRRVLDGTWDSIFAVSAQAAIQGIQKHWESIQLLSLDHDLEKQDVSDPDPGDGRDVAKWLATQLPRFPILIHTSNSIMGDSMYFTLIESGFSVDRIDPYD